MPRAQAPPGTPVAFHGHDLLAVDDRGRFTTYWVVSEGLEMMRQLGWPGGEA